MSTLTEVNNVIRDLKLIQKVKNIYDKINVGGRFIQHDSWITSVSRTMWYTNENRIKTIQFIDDTINKAFELLILIPKHGVKHDYGSSPETNKVLDKIYVDNIYNNIIACKDGIVNLKNKTYSGDDDAEIRLDAIIMKLQLIDEFVN